MHIWKKNKKSLRLISLLAAVIIALTLMLPSFAAKTAHTVKVGFFPLGKFQYYDGAGNPAGYNVDYLNKLSQVTHWKYEYVKCANWVGATALL